MTRAVLFDFGDTLVTGRVDIRGFRTKTLQLLRRRGLIRKQDHDRATTEVIGKLRRLRQANREMTFEEVNSEILRRVGLRPGDELLDFLHRLYYSCYSWAPMYGALQILEELQLRYRLGIVSNTISRIPLIALEKLQLSDLFQVVVLSRDLGRRKPDPLPFNHTLTQLGVPPTEAVFVGNDLHADVLGAKKVGMRTIWLTARVAPGSREADATVERLIEVPPAIEEMSRARGESASSNPSYAW
ncbi:MAG: HAD family hydrolase [Candidatus Geothermarchaeales archaeon]